MSAPSCCYCGRPMSTGWAREVIGWEEPRQGGGLHALTDRRPTGRYCCPECIREIKQGVSPNSPKLF